MARQSGYATMAAHAALGRDVLKLIGKHGLKAEKVRERVPRKGKKAKKSKLNGKDKGAALAAVDEAATEQ